MIFWLAAGGLLALVMGRLVWQALRGAPVTRESSAADYLQSRTTGILRATQAGDIAPEHLADLEIETARAALADAAHEVAAPRPQTGADRFIAAMMILIALPAIAIPVYLQLGTPTAAPSATTAQPHMNPADMVRELKARIEKAPAELEPRLWLARVYMSTGQYHDAVQTFEALETLAPTELAVLIQYADALAMTQDGKLDGKAIELITRALKIDPQNVTALWLSGIAADQTGDFGAALDFLQRAKEASANTETPTEELDRLIAEIEARSGLKATRPVSTASTISGNARITAAIDVDPEIRAQLPPTTTVFVIAKTPTGPPLPRAVKRVTLADLPMEIVLDDSLAMSPEFKLSGATQVKVIARISRSGNAIAASGDFEGSVGPLVVGPDTTATVLIKDVVP